MARFVVFLSLFASALANSSSSYAAQATSSQSVAATTITSVPVRSSSQTGIPTTLVPSSTPTTTSAAFNLDDSSIDKLLTTVTIDGHAIPVTCTNCTITGGLEVSASEIEWSDDPFEDIEHDELGLSGGIVNASFPDGLAGRVELTVPLLSSFTETLHVFSYPVVGFDVPDVGSAGVIVSVKVPLSVQFNNPGNLTFGFEWSIPSGSLLEINIPAPENSTTQGFTHEEGLQISTLPVKFDSPGPDFTVGVALQVELSVGISILDNDALAEVGATASFPITAQVAQLDASQVNAQCNPRRSGATSPAKPSVGARNSTIPAQGQPAGLGNYTHIVPKVGANLVVFAEDGLKIHMPDVGSLGTENRVATTLLSDSWALPTACIDNFPKPTTTTTGANGATSTSSNHSGGSAFAVPSKKISLFSLCVAVAWLTFAY